MSPSHAWPCASSLCRPRKSGFLDLCLPWTPASCPIPSTCWCSGLLCPTVGERDWAHWCSYLSILAVAHRAHPEALVGCGHWSPKSSPSELSTWPSVVHSLRPLHGPCLPRCTLAIGPALTPLSVSFDTVRVDDSSPLLPRACRTCCWRAGPHRVLCMGSEGLRVSFGHVVWSVDSCPGCSSGERGSCECAGPIRPCKVDGVPASGKTDVTLLCCQLKGHFLDPLHTLILIKAL